LIADGTQYRADATHVSLLGGVVIVVARWSSPAPLARASSLPAKARPCGASLRCEDAVISVIVPVKDGGDDLRRCLDGIARQRVDDQVETLVVDSGSTDGSRELARSRGARVLVVEAEGFLHGATRNLAAGQARGELLVFTTQDAYPVEEDWLERLCAPLRAEQEVAGVYGRQIPHADAAPPERFFLDFLYPPSPRLQQVSGPAELSLRTTLFSNVNSAIRRSFWERFPFADDLFFAEDQDWSRRVLLAGYAIQYEPEAAVRHSHAYTLTTAFKRFFDSGASAERGYLAGGSTSSAVLRREALRYAREELAWLTRTGQRRWIPYAATYELGKFLGVQLGARHRRLPLWLKRRCSFFPAYWEHQAQLESTAPTAR
jgi:GT2 family glycosyltransferase